MFKPRRILWVGAIVGIAYLVWRWRQQQIAEIAPTALPVAPPPAPPAQAVASPAATPDAAQAGPRRIVTRVHRGAPPTPSAGQSTIVVANNGAAQPAAPPAPAAPAAPDAEVSAPVSEAAMAPTLGEAPEAAAESTMTLAPALAEAPAPEAPAPSPINLNTADVDALIALPGIGPALAARIISYREEHGPFSDVEQLIDVQGIGPNNMSDFRHLIYV